MPRKRNSPNSRLLPTLRIYCEGAKTEPQYLHGYIHSLENSEIISRIHCVPTDKNTPIQLVDVAVRDKKSRSRIPGDDYWVVYDRESVSKYSDVLHAAAMDKARTNGVNVAICNVCFEYWILLHYVDTSAPYASFEDLVSRSGLKSHVLTSCGVPYEKSLNLIYWTSRSSISIARERAKRLNAAGQLMAPVGKNKQFQINPFVGFVSLLDAIDEFR